MTAFGSTFIEVVAKLDKLEDGLRAATQHAVKAGEEAGRAFAENVGDAASEQIAEAASEAVSELKADLKEAEADLKELGKSQGEAYADAFGAAAQAAQPSNLLVGAGQNQGPAVSSGRRFGQAFFGAVADSYGSGGAAKLGNVFAKQLGPMAVAGMADGIADFLRSDKSIGEALNDGLRSIPFVGSFVNLGTAIYESTFGAADKAAEDLIAKEQAARAGILAARASAAKEEQESLQRLDALRVDEQRLQLAMDLRRLSRDSSDEDTARFKAQAQAIQLERDLRFALAGDISEHERDQLRRNHEYRLREIEDAAQTEIDAIRERAQIQAEADAEKQRQLDEQAAREEEQIAARAKASADELLLAQIRLKAAQDSQGADEARIKQVAEAERVATAEVRKRQELASAQSDEERAAIERRYEVEDAIAKLQGDAAKAQKQAAASAEGIATALGTFKFDPYPPREQRQVQERTMRAAEKTASALAMINMGVQ